MNKDDFKPYKYDKFAKIPSWLKILFLKYWAAGAAYYFIGFGGVFIGVYDDFTFQLLLGAVLGLFIEYIVKQIIRLMHNSKDNTYRFNLINFKGVKGLLLNLLYALIIIQPMCEFLSFIVGHNLWFDINGQGAKGGDPFIFGFVFLLFDYTCVGIKNLIQYLIEKRKQNSIIRNNSSNENISD